MRTPRRFNKDFYGGAIMMVIGLYAAVVGWRYDTGTLSQMGPGFMPVAVGVLLTATGVLIAVFAPRDVEPIAGPPPVGHAARLPDPRGALCIVLGMLAFMLVGRYGGLVPATFAIVFISALGDRANSVKDAVCLALALCVVAAVVFSWALRLQLPLFKWGG